jgi:hypothetical protein
MINSTVMKAELLAYWRYVRQCPIVAVEVFDQDVMSITKSRGLVITEVKVSISDLRADGSKEIHFRAASLYGIKKDPKSRKEQRAAYLATYRTYTHDERTPNQFYFAVPEEIYEKALAIIEERYPYAGLLCVKHYVEHSYWGHFVTVIRVAPTLHKEKCSIKTISALVKSMTASLCSAYKYVVKAQPKETPVENPPNQVS